MNKTFRYTGGAVVGAVALLAASALPASADDTATTFTITGGALSMSVQPTANLGADATGSTTATGNLGAVSVNDQRGTSTVWALSASSTQFAGPVNSGSLSTNVAYNAGVIAETGTVSIADGVSVDVDAGAASVASPTTQTGVNTASWDPTLTVTLPSDSLAGAYTGTVTSSVL